MATVHELTMQVQALTVTNNALLAQLKCPVCLDTCLPPIYMCHKGHNLCSNCRSKVNECPTCREPGRPDIQNVFAEGISRQFAVDCKNKLHGCQSMILKSKLDEHILDCLYRFTCRSCHVYHGDIPGLTKHLTATHNALYREGDVYDGVIQVTPRSTRYLDCHGGLFCIAIGQGYYNGLGLDTEFLGPRKIAGDFHCWFEFTSEDGAFKFPCRVPCSPTGTNTNLITTPDCLKMLKRKDCNVLCKIKIERLNLM